MNKVRLRNGIENYCLVGTLSEDKGRTCRKVKEQAAQPSGVRDELTSSDLATRKQRDTWKLASLGPRRIRVSKTTPGSGNSLSGRGRVVEQLLEYGVEDCPMLGLVKLLPEPSALRNWNFCPICVEGG